MQSLNARNTRRNRKSKKNQPTRRPRFHPDSPPMIWDHAFDQPARQIHPEQREAVEALKKLRELAKRRFDRITKLLEIPEGSITLELSPREYDLKQLDKSNVWRRGRERSYHILPKDSCTLEWCAINSQWCNIQHDAEQLSGDLNATLTGYLRSVGIALLASAQRLEDDLKANPDQWVPMPSLTEFMAGDVERWEPTPEAMKGGGQ